MIRVRGLSKAFGALRAVDALSFDAAANRVTSIIGPNGAGKSTAFNLIAGTLRPDAGTVELQGRDITGEPPYALTRLGVARSFQITRTGDPTGDLVVNIAVTGSATNGADYSAIAATATILDGESFVKIGRAHV